MRKRGGGVKIKMGEPKLKPQRNRQKGKAESIKNRQRKRGTLRRKHIWKDN